MAQSKSRLKKEITAKVVSAEILIERISQALGVSFHTIKYRWLEQDAEQLTLPIPVNLIKEHFGISKTTDITEVYKYVKPSTRKKIPA